MAWQVAKPYHGIATGALGPARGGIIRTVVLTPPIAGSALMTFADSAGGTVIGSVRAPIGQSVVFSPEAFYRGQGTVTLSAGTVTMYIAPGAGTAL